MEGNVVEVNLEIAEKEFMKYVNGYDIKNSNVVRKIGHSIRVKEISKDIAKSLGLNEEYINLAELIGLLHDVGRFEQIKIYDTFKDSVSIDHGDLGVEILQKNNYIRNFIDDDKYDKIIFKAIKNHNKYMMEDGLTKEELLFAKIVKDADKIDILYQGVKIFWSKEEDRKNVEISSMSDEIYEKYNERKLINRVIVKTYLDRVIANASFIFDINFRYSYEFLKEKDYINQILNKFNFDNDVTIQRVEQVRKIANEYIESKIKEGI